jgi:hypothetical protein
MMLIGGEALLRSASFGGQPSPRPRLASRSLGEGWWSIGESTLSLIIGALRNLVAVWLQELTSYEVPSKDISTKEFPAEISSTHAGKFSSRTSMSSLFLQFPVRTQITFKLCGAKA